jgi:hypothetical protein
MWDTFRGSESKNNYDYKGLCHNNLIRTLYFGITNKGYYHSGNIFSKRNKILIFGNRKKNSKQNMSSCKRHYRLCTIEDNCLSS